MLLEVMREVSNYFEDADNKQESEFSIVDNTVELAIDLNISSYIIITGSTLSDDLYLITDKEVTANGYTYTLEAEPPLQDEIFSGIIYPLKIPRAFHTLVEAIKANVEKTPQSAITSERFADYAYSLATGKDGAPIGWNTVFSSQLHRWRKPRTGRGIKL